MSEAPYTPEYHREQARKLREAAERPEMSRVRDELLFLAKAYERLASRIEQTRRPS